MKGKMLELFLIKYLLLVENYTKYRDSIKLKPEDKELKVLYSFLDDLHASYGRTITLDEFKLSVLNQYPEFTIYTDQLEKVDIGEEVLSDLLKQVIERQLAYDIALLSIDVSEGRKPVSDLYNMLAKMEEEGHEEVVEDFVTDDIEILYNETIHRPGLRWRLRALNESLGSLRRGDFGFIFARPETGKTTFLACEATYMASQLKEDDGPILWFNNEEGGYKVKTRIMQSALGCTLRDLYIDRQKSMDYYLNTTHGKIKLKDSATINKREIERLCKEYKPSLIIFDQIDKIKGFDDDREDLRLGSIYIWARELAKTYCPVIGVCQSDATGEGKKWLTMDNVANAKTSKQAEADWILGIGTVHDEGMKYVRYLHLSKNKLSGDEDTQPEQRHGKMEVIIMPDVARYKDFQ